MNEVSCIPIEYNHNPLINIKISIYTYEKEKKNQKNLHFFCCRNCTIGNINIKVKNFLIKKNDNFTHPYPISSFVMILQKMRWTLQKRMPWECSFFNATGNWEMTIQCTCIDKTSNKFKMAQWS